MPKYIDNENADSIKEHASSIQQFALPEYLVFLIMGHIKELRNVAPDHVLVKAVEEILEQELAPPKDSNSARCQALAAQYSPPKQCRLLRNHEGSHEYFKPPEQLDLFA